MPTSIARTTLLLVILFTSSPLPADWDGGVAAFNAGRYSDATEQFRGVVEGSPQAPAGHFMLGMSLLRGEQLEAGLASLGQAVELDGGDVRYRLNFGKAQLDAGRPDAALGTLMSQDPAQVPTETFGYYAGLLARAALESGRPEDARRALERALETEDGSKPLWLALATVARRSNLPRQAFAARVAAYELAPGDAEGAGRTALSAFAIAQEQGDEAARRAWYEKGFEFASRWAEASKSAEAYRLAGEAKIGAGDYEAAGNWFGRAAAKSSGDPLPRYKQAVCALAAQQPEAALDHARAALALAPDRNLERQILETQGSAHRRLGEFEKAAETFRRAGNDAKAAEMGGFHEASIVNNQFAREQEECRKKVAGLEALQREHKDLEGTDAWAQLEQALADVLAACAEHLREDA